MSLSDEIYPTAHELEIFTSQDDAIRGAMADAQPGDVIVVHEQACAIVGDDEATCTCTPLAFTVPSETPPS